MNLHPTEQEIGFVGRMLTAFNDEAVGPDGHRPLNIVEYDGDGNVVAGLCGGTYWGWMHLDVLWVSEACRRQGIGSRLLEAAEKEAADRGCRHVHVDTMSWQAPLFYRKRGYRVISVLEDIPEGHRKYHLVKDL